MRQPTLIASLIVAALVWLLANAVIDKIVAALMQAGM